MCKWFYSDRREFKARVIGKDDKTDVAVVKIDAGNLPAITIGDSDKVQVGDYALAIGNPFGVGQTVTMGIVSATHRGGNLEYRELRGLHPDRCRDQSRKLGRRAGERPRRADRHQHGHHRARLARAIRASDSRCP